MTDTDPTSITAGGALDDTSAVEKFKLSSDAYDKAGGSDFRKFRAARAKGRGPPITDDFQAEEAKALEVGRYVGARLIALFGRGTCLLVPDKPLQCAADANSRRLGVAVSSSLWDTFQR